MFSPNVLVLAVFATSFAVSRATATLFCDQSTGFELIACGKHVGVGGVCALITCVALIMFEREFLRDLALSFKGKQS
jgi:hypothetical protein